MGHTCSALKVLVTGSSGLIGSEVCSYFDQKGYIVHGIDNNQRAVFFGSQGDTRWRLKELKENLHSYTHHEVDIRDRSKILDLFSEIKPDAIVHAAAQPSHDKAASIPFDDFDINAVGTLNLLEATRQFCSDSPFVHMSSNKVYGDRPNNIPMVELEKRWDYDDTTYINGIPESLPIDQCKHSLFGASKVASDVMVQEYGRYFGMATCCLRGGCLTGVSHSSVQLHGFLSYLVKCNSRQDTYNVFGYKGKQVRDNIHSEDVAQFIWLFIESPRVGEVYNLGGGKANSCSILEAFEICEYLSGTKQKYEYSEINRIGDHICYYSDLSKIYSHFPDFEIKYSIENIIEQILNKQHQSK